MSLRHEQRRSLQMTRELLAEIISGPTMPARWLREAASVCLRHFPLMDKDGEPIWSQDSLTEPKRNDP